MAEAPTSASLAHRNEITTTHKTVVGKAVAYGINQWNKRNAFLLDGSLGLDNNRSIKPFVIGRKNWLFANTPAGAKVSATIYSIVETAKESGLDPFAYITYVFEQIRNTNKNERKAIGRLLPTSPDLPEYVSMKPMSLSCAGRTKPQQRGSYLTLTTITAPTARLCNGQNRRSHVILAALRAGILYQSLSLTQCGYRICTCL
jgi:hypothetical protein